MKLKKLHLKNLRIVKEINLDCSMGIHFIHGPNAQGKTSILEAIYLLSNLRSFRDPDASALIQNGEKATVVKGEFLIAEETQAELKVELIQTHRLEKKAYINQKLAKSAADYFGVKLQHSPIQFHAITLNPTSTDLIRGEPNLRRTYLNQAIASESPEYLNHLKRYQKALDHKNALLKQDGPMDHGLLKILNETIVTEGVQIIQKRIIFLSQIARPLHHFLSQIAPDQKQPKIGYFSKIFESNFKAQHLYFTGHFDLPSIDFLTELYQKQIHLLMAQERLRKTSLVGPHRDDFVFKMGFVGNGEALDKDLVDVGSQGEIRSLLLALKLSELEQFQAKTNVQPVLLIDDFSSELDKTRRGFLLDYLKDSHLQIFVTSTDDPATLNVSLNNQGNAYKILQGKIQ